MCVRFPALKGSCENARCGLRHGGSAITRLPSPPAAAPSARFRPALSLVSGNRPRFTAGPRLSERSSRSGTGGERWSPWCAWLASAARMRRDAVVSRRPASTPASPRAPRWRSPPSQLSPPAPPPSISGPLALIAEECALHSYLLSYSSYSPTRPKTPKINYMSHQQLETRNPPSPRLRRTSRRTSLWTSRWVSRQVNQKPETRNQKPAFAKAMAGKPETIQPPAGHSMREEEREASAGKAGGRRRDPDGAADADAGRRETTASRRLRAADAPPDGTRREAHSR